MEKVTPSESFRKRAYEAISAARDDLAHEHVEAAVSRAYYACYYAIHSRLESMGEVAGSHKQTGILFRKFFIKTGRLDKKYSIILRELSEWRMDSDYAPFPEIDKVKATELIDKAANFVDSLLNVE